MEQPFVVGLASIAVLGAAAQWLGWKLRFPALLFLMAFGFLAGPEGAGVIDPDAMFGPLLLPLIALSVSILLFEGSLTLSLPELGENLRVVARLVTLGAAITWALSAVAAHLALGFAWPLAVLAGAVLTVTGPTVVLPLLRHVRPTGPVGPVLKWEGILIDPVGAVLAVLVFEGIVEGAGIGPALAGITRTIVLGGGIGVVAAWLLVALLGRFLVPDHLHSPVALALAVGSFALGNQCQHEAGLLTVTVMGAVLANQRRVDIGHILEFKENLRVLVISTLFILLAARTRVADLAALDAGAVVFLVLLIAVVRPASVLACTARSTLTVRERLFLSGVAPRGVVAAAVTAVFALRLERLGFDDATRLVPVILLVIVGTVAVYGIGARPLAMRAGLAAPAPQGVLLVGAHDFARALAATLRDAGLPVLLVDTNAQRTRLARMAGLPVYHGSVLTERADEELDLAGLGRVLGLTGNDEVNTLSAMHFVHLFGRAEVYHLPPRRELAPQLRARILFGEEWTYAKLRTRFKAGATVKATPLTERFGLDEWRDEHGADALPLLAIDANGQAKVATVDSPLDPGPGDTVVALVG